MRWRNSAQRPRPNDAAIRRIFFRTLVRAPARKDTKTAASPPIRATNTKTAAKLRIPTNAPTTVKSLTSPAPPAPTANSANKAANPPSAPSRPGQNPSPYTVWAMRPAGRAGSVSQLGMRRDCRSVIAAASTTRLSVTRIGRGGIIDSPGQQCGRLIAIETLPSQRLQRRNQRIIVGEQRVRKAELVDL